MIFYASRLLLKILLVPVDIIAYGMSRVSLAGSAIPKRIGTVAFPFRDAYKRRVHLYRLVLFHT